VLADLSVSQALEPRKGSRSRTNGARSKAG
jgi:hypothetical protein